MSMWKTKLVTGPNSDIFTLDSTELPQLAFLFLPSLTPATRSLNLPQVTHISDTVSANTNPTQKAQIIATPSKYKYHTQQAQTHMPHTADINTTTHRRHKHPPYTEDTNIYQEVHWGRI